MKKLTGATDIPAAVRATAHIRRNSDGVVREFKTDWYGAIEEYLWSEGNYACDCNRADFFARAGNEPDNDQAECGATLFTVLKIVLDDGMVVYSDDE